LTVTDPMPAQAANDPLSPRLQQFQTEVESLKVTGGRANPERTWMIVGAVGMGAGVILALIGWLLAGGTNDPSKIGTDQAMGVFGLTLAVAGMGLFTVMSLRRWFRYWLVRFIYEMRDQTDRVVTK
jgi:hypothetical protein